MEEAEEETTKLREMEIEAELEEMRDEVPNLTNIGRRASVSLPSGLDLLLQITEYSWETNSKNRRDSLADSLVKSAVQDVKKTLGDCNAIIRSESEIELSELSEMDQSPSDSPGPSHASEPRKKRRVGISQAPKINNEDLDPDEIEFRQHSSKRSLAGRRKSGIIPLKIMNSNYLKSNPEDEEEAKIPLNSPQNIKNFIKGKFSGMSVPGVLKRRKPPGEYKLHAFVAFLLLTILLLVGSIYVIHKEKELQKAYYEQIRFSAKDRRIRVSNWKGKEVLTGTLGWTMTKKDKAWPCLPVHQKENQTCLEWMNKARLYFSTVETNGKKENVDGSEKPSIQCYGIFWESLNENFKVKDCFDIGNSKGSFWYGGGEMGSNQWPLNRTFMPLSPFTTGNKIGRKEWGRTMNRLFVSAPGGALKVPSEIPLFVSINQEPNYLCISAQQNKFAYPGAVNNLNYTICTGDSVKEMSVFLADKDIWDGLKHEDVHSTYALALSPIWRIHPDILGGNISEASLLNHTDRIAALHISEGYILLDESWQRSIGDLEVDAEKFPTMVETFDISRRRGFKVALTIQPFFSTESKNYLEALPLNLWAKERETKRVPALTQFKNHSPGLFAVLDVTNGTARVWLKEKVTLLVEKYKIEALFADVGTATDFPHYYEFQERLSSLDYYKDLFLTALRAVPNVKTIGLSSAVKLPKLPTFVALSPTERSWEGLQSLIPNMLTLGVTGFPFIIPGSIGGDNGKKPEKDLYMRWLQLAHFLPVVQYSFLPSDYDSLVVDLATKMNQIRKKKLFRYLKKAIDEALTSGLGMIRPLWLIDPNDPNCLKVWDEFSIGGDIIVAPVIKPNATERDIYLPKGKWRDELDGSSTKGEKWLHNYRVRQNQIAFFTKITDGPN